MEKAIADSLNGTPKTNPCSKAQSSSIYASCSVFYLPRYFLASMRPSANVRHWKCAIMAGFYRGFTACGIYTARVRFYSKRVLRAYTKVASYVRIPIIPQAELSCFECFGLLTGEELLSASGDSWQQLFDQHRQRRKLWRTKARPHLPRYTFVSLLLTDVCGKSHWVRLAWNVSHTM